MCCVLYNRFVSFESVAAEFTLGTINSFEKYTMLPDVDKKPEKPLMVKMAGYLEKKGRMRVVGVRRWKKRWCVLEGKLLLYFKTQLEYSHHLSPCRGSVNMGLVLSVTLRGPCQLQIVTRSQIIILRTKSKPEQEEWFAALRDACGSNNLQQTLVRRREHRKSTAAANAADKEAHDRTSATVAAKPCGRADRKNRGGAMLQVAAENDVSGGRPRSRPPRHTAVEDAFFVAAKRNSRNSRGIADRGRPSSAAMRKSESDNRISFYRELHGLVRTDDALTAAAAAANCSGADCKEHSSGCRSRSLSYESIYFKPQQVSGEPQPDEAAKSRSCRELGPAVADAGGVTRGPADVVDGSVSKAMSRSETFFQKRSCEDSDSDDYDYVEVAKLKCSAPIEESEQPAPPVRLPGDGRADTGTAPSSSARTVAALQTSDSDSCSDDREPNVDVVYVNSDRKTMAELVMEYGGGTERTADVPEDEPPPPLPAKKKKSVGEELRPDCCTPQKRSLRRTADGRGVYVYRDGADEVIYDVPIPHGELIEHFRRLTVRQASASPVKRYADNGAYDDSLEPAPSLYGTLHMAPDSLEIAVTFPAYKRWSNDSGFNNYYEESCNTYSPDQMHFEDSLEPVVAMMHRDRKIWQNVPNINSNDYFR